MPTLEVSTKSANSVWRSPDGQREIFEVILDYQGRTFKGKTYSKEIAVPGWTGEIESYEKQGRQGVETFVKQPQKEGFQGGYGRPAGGSKPSYQPKDEKAIQAMWAIGQAVQWLKDRADTDVTYLEPLAKDIFAMVDRVKTDEPTGTDEVHTVLDDEPVDLSKIKEIMGDVDNEGEQPWPPIPKT